MALVDSGEPASPPAMTLYLTASKYPRGLACLAKVTKWPPQSEENTASGFLAICALMNGV